ncbi:MAG: DNA polymerase III subunit delta [Gemmatimonadetes bacterium]|nr:DNA polymerase III subunit delta [Gemmatimonadota bacterium]
MPIQPFDTFFKAVRKGEIPPVVYLHGQESVLKEEIVAAIVDRLLDPSLRDFNLDQRSATTLDPEQAESICNTLPMMAERRVAIIRDVEAWNKRAKAKNVVVRYLAKPAAETVLILVQGDEDEIDPDLAAGAITVAAAPLSNDRAKKWLLLHAGRLGLEMEDTAAEHMVQATDGSLAAIRSELEKLAGLASDVPLTLERVSAFLGVRHGETQYDWRDAVLAGKTGAAAAMLPRILAQSGVSGVGLVSLLGTSVAGLGLARTLHDRGQRGTALAQAIKNALFKSRPARVNYEAAAAQWSRLAGSWPRPRVEAAFRALLAADERLKSTTVADEAAVMFDLIMELGIPWHTAAVA